MPRLSGRVMEKWTGMPVSGAVVNVNGVAIIADAGGNFAIDTPGATANIQVMHVNYQTANVNAPNGSQIEIDLVPNARAL